MRFIDLFCGMGTIRMGFEQAGHECVYAVEWDKHKRRIYEVIFGHEPQGSDITNTRAADFPAADCWSFGAPCQDFSIAGLREGMEGDRSSLVREVFRLVRDTPKEHRPEWLLYENVKGMLSSNKGFDYLEILFEMASLGYDIEYQLLNSKDFGVPQNRERVYTIGHLGRFGGRKVFPIDGEVNSADCQQFSDGTGIAYCLDTGYGKGISPNYSDKAKRTQVIQIGNISPTEKRSNPNHGRIYDSSGIAPTLLKMQGGQQQPFIVDSYDLKSVKSSTRRGMVKHGITGALDTQCNVGVTNDKRIRRLTPRECMRLQGVSDYIIDKLIEAGISDTQMYRAAGDACTVNVIYEIAKRLGK